MQYLLFFKVNKGYYIQLDLQAMERKYAAQASSKLELFPSEFFAAFEDGQTVNREYLDETFPNQLTLESDNYLVSKDNSVGEYYVFIPLRKSIWRSIFMFRGKPSSHLFEKAEDYAKSTITKFKLNKREEFLLNLIGEKTDLKDCVQAFSHHYFFDRFAFWVYNPYTEVFSCLAKSHTLQKEYIDDKENSSLHEFLKKGDLFECRLPRRGCVNQKFAKPMETLNRIRIDLGEGEIGLLDFLSRYPNFGLQEEAQNHIRNFLETKYLEFRQKSQAAFHEILVHFSSYTTGHIDNFLYGLTEKVCRELCFEACSIFLVDPDAKFLTLTATSDKMRKGKPPPGIHYDLNRRSKTGAVFKSKMMGFSYDLMKDRDNTHTYDEPTRSKPRTWICILLKSSRKWGILRVKNRFKNQDSPNLVNIIPDDCKNLETICTHLANILDIEEGHNKYVKLSQTLRDRRDLLKNQIDELTHFYNVFLHEIRTPISTFSTSTERIKRLLRTPVLDEQIVNWIKAKVDDIKVIGHRLAFITDTYYFDELVKSQQHEPLWVMHDIVFPVFNITRDYVKKQFDVDIILHPKTLEGHRIYGDKIRLNIVFNALISNAGKYSPRSEKPIRVYGERDDRRGFFYIVVENYGFPIHQDEKLKIFESGYQGKEVRNQKLGGTGIGLYLGKRIMKNQKGGDLLLVSCSNPIIFKMKVPMR